MTELEGIRIIGNGYYVPEKIVTNDDLSKIVETNDEWITTRTGIKERHFVTDEKNVDIACIAAEKAIQDAGINKEDIGVVIVATFSPDFFTPSIACFLQKKLGLSEDIPFFDINAACSGFVYGLSVIRGMLLQSKKKYGLLVGSETISNLLDFTDRGSCILFGDGAGAVIVKKEENCIFEAVLGGRGDEEILICPCTDEKRKIIMDGREVFKFAVKIIPKCINEVLENSGEKLENIDYIVCHQANIRIIEYVSKTIKVPMEKFFVNIDKYGNTSAASIPIALTEMKEQGLLKSGSKIICVGFGAGFTWGGTLLEW